MNMDNRKSSLAIGPRTRQNVLTGKKIRKHEDGYDIFEDYWTDSDHESLEGTFNCTHLDSLLDIPKARNSNLLNVNDIEEGNATYNVVPKSTRLMKSKQMVTKSIVSQSPSKSRQDQSMLKKSASKSTINKISTQDKIFCKSPTKKQKLSQLVESEDQPSTKSMHNKTVILSSPMKIGEHDALSLSTAKNLTTNINAVATPKKASDTNHNNIPGIHLLSKTKVLHNATNSINMLGSGVYSASMFKETPIKSVGTIAPENQVKTIRNQVLDSLPSNIERSNTVKRKGIFKVEQILADYDEYDAEIMQMVQENEKTVRKRFSFSEELSPVLHPVGKAWTESNILNKTVKSKDTRKEVAPEEIEPNLITGKYLYQSKAFYKELSPTRNSNEENEGFANEGNTELSTRGSISDEMDSVTPPNGGKKLTTASSHFSLHKHNSRFENQNVYDYVQNLENPSEHVNEKTEHISKCRYVNQNTIEVADQNSENTIENSNNCYENSDNGDNNPNEICSNKLSPLKENHASEIYLKRKSTEWQFAPSKRISTAGKKSKTHSVIKASEHFNEETEHVSKKASKSRLVTKQHTVEITDQNCENLIENSSDCNENYDDEHNGISTNTNLPPLKKNHAPFSSSPKHVSSVGEKCKTCSHKKASKHPNEETEDASKKASKCRFVSKQYAVEITDRNRENPIENNSDCNENYDEHNRTPTNENLLPLENTPFTSPPKHVSNIGGKYETCSHKKVSEHLIEEIEHVSKKASKSRLVTKQHTVEITDHNCKNSIENRGDFIENYEEHNQISINENLLPLKKICTTFTSPQKHVSTVKKKFKRRSHMKVSTSKHINESSTQHHEIDNAATSRTEKKNKFVNKTNENILNNDFDQPESLNEENFISKACSPHISEGNMPKKKHVFMTKDTAQIRKSTRQKYAPLAHWRNERLCYRFEKGEIKILGIDKGSKEDDAAAKSIVNKIKYKRDVVKNPRKAKLYDAVANKNVSVHLLKKYSLIPWENESKSNQSYSIKRVFETANSAFGFLQIGVKEEKPPQYMPNEDLNMMVVKGKVEVTIQENTYILDEKDMMMIPRSTAYCVKNIGVTKALLTFVVGKFEFMESQT